MTYLSHMLGRCQDGERLEETVTPLVREIASMGLTPFGKNYV